MAKAVRPPNPSLFLHVQAECPCCAKEIALTYRSVGYLAVVEVKHWNQAKENP
jgi:hypothetical protein